MLQLLAHFAQPIPMRLCGLELRAPLCGFAAVGDTF
jgi:hypothetical protein